MQNLTDQIFGKLVVVDREKGRWYCLCECGGFVRATSQELRRKEIKNCGCKPPRRKIRSNLVGKKFGHLTALFPTDGPAGKHVEWMYQCDCGNYRKSQHGHVLRSKDSASCGCKIGEHAPGRRSVNTFKHIEGVCRIYYEKGPI